MISHATDAHHGNQGSVNVGSQDQPTHTAMNLIKRKPEIFDTDMFEFPTRFFDNNFFRERDFPMINIRNLDREFQVELAVPGYKKEDLKVEVAEGVLTVSSEQREESASDKDGWKRREFRYNGFSRSFQLPENADADSVKASFSEGVLGLSIAKKDGANDARPKAIAIK